MNIEPEPAPIRVNVTEPAVADEAVAVAPVQVPTERVQVMRTDAAANDRPAVITDTGRTNRYLVGVEPQVPSAGVTASSIEMIEEQVAAEPEIDVVAAAVTYNDRELTPFDDDMLDTASARIVEIESAELTEDSADDTVAAASEMGNIAVAVEPAPVVVVRPAITLESIDESSVPDSRLPIQPNHAGLRSLEKKLVAIGDLPTIDQPLSAIRVAYERLASSPDLSGRDAAIINARLTQIEHQQKLQATLIEITVKQQSLNESQRQRDMRAAGRAPEYLAVGKLSASSLYDGAKLPLLYRVTNPMNGLTIAYLRQSPDSPDLRRFVGQYIGVTGIQESTPGIKTSYIVPQHIDMLTADTATANRSLVRLDTNKKRSRFTAVSVFYVRC